MTAGGTDDARSCPRCKQALARAELRKVPVDGCKSCQRTLVPQPDLPRLLESLSAALWRHFDPDAEIEAVKDANDRVGCPHCSKVMDRDDYCAAGVVFFDRCNGCALLWFDADELGAMAIMWARMNARQERSHALNRELIPQSVVYIDRRMLGSAVWAGLLFW